MAKNNNFKKLLASFVAGCSIATISITAFAASTQTGTIGSYSCNGYNYMNFNTISTAKNSYGEKYASGMTCVMNKDNKSLPAGYAGAYSRLYASDGTLVDASSSWMYNPANSGGIGAEEAKYYPSSNNESFYSQGSTKAWNGSSYYTYSTYATPCLNDYS